MSRPLEDVIAVLRYRHKAASEQIATWLSDAADRPSEFEFAPFQAAACLQVFGRIIEASDAPESKMTLASLTKHVQREVQNGARFPLRSTSPTVNLMSQEHISAWAELAEIMDLV